MYTDAQNCRLCKNIQIKLTHGRRVCNFTLVVYEEGVVINVTI